MTERLLANLRAAVEHVQAHPEERGGIAPVCDMAVVFPLRGMIAESLKRYLDLLYNFKAALAQLRCKVSAAGVAWLSLSAPVMPVRVVTPGCGCLC